MQADKAWNEGLKYHTDNPNNIPVRPSTNGYCHEIDFLQL